MTLESRCQIFWSENVVSWIEKPGSFYLISSNYKILGDQSLNGRKWTWIEVKFDWGWLGGAGTSLGFSDNGWWARVLSRRWCHVRFSTFLENKASFWQHKFLFGFLIWVSYSNSLIWSVQSWNMITLLNKENSNKVTLSRDKIPLKCSHTLF